MHIGVKWLSAAIMAVSLAGQTASACHLCKQTPCVLAPPPQPAYECVTEMVPVTVMKTKTRVDLVPVCTKTLMETKPVIDYVEQIHPVCKPVYDTVFVPRCYTVCRQVCETSMVCQPYKVCRPVTTTRQVTEYCLKPFTELVTVPVKIKCGRCGHAAGGCTCQTVARTCYKRVPVVRDVVETHMVTEIRTQMIPVLHYRVVTEQKIQQVPVTTCRMVPEIVRVRVPVLTFECVPKTLVYKTAVLSCEEIPVTVYRPVVKMVPVVVPSPQVTPALQAASTSFRPKPAVERENSPAPQVARQKNEKADLPKG
jgi:hypothetical protein